MTPLIDNGAVLGAYDRVMLTGGHALILANHHGVKTDIFFWNDMLGDVYRFHVTQDVLDAVYSDSFATMTLATFAEFYELHRV